VQDQVEGIEIFAQLGGEFVEEDALGFEFGDDGLLLLGGAPGGEKVVERGETAADDDARVVAQGFGDQPAVRPVVLHLLAGDIDRHVADHVLDARLAGLALLGDEVDRVVLGNAGIVGRRDGLVGLGS
jgi:hypothetical protein